MTAHINTNGDFLCLLIFNAYQTSDKSLRDNRCASTRSLKAFGLEVFVRLNKLLVGSHVEDRTQTHRKINRSPPPPPSLPLLMRLCRQALHVWVFVLVRLFVTACCASCCCWAIPAENCSKHSQWARWVSHRGCPAGMWPFPAAEVLI